MGRKVESNTKSLLDKNPNPSKTAAHQPGHTLHPLPTYITRCLAINRSPNFILHRDKKFSASTAKPAEANKLLNELKPSEKKVFHRATLDRTRKLRNANEERGKQEHLEAEEA